MSLVGRTLGKYQIHRKVGSGGMGEVYAATDTVLDRPVALKLIAQVFASHGEALERFHREARTAARLVHPGIVRVFESGQLERHPYIAMEFLEGMSGRGLSKSGMSLVERLDVVAQVCDALQYAHEQGVVHRDVKPGNIIVLAGGRAKLIDFGLARISGDEMDLTRGQIIGSGSYMSPEQLDDPRSVDFRSDIFSAGSVLYEAISGKAPFAGASLADTILKIAREAAPSLRAVSPAAPPSLVDLVARCHAKDPRDRPRSAAEVAAGIRAVIEQLESEARERATMREHVALRISGEDADDSASPYAVTGVVPPPEPARLDRSSPRIVRPAPTFPGRQVDGTSPTAVALPPAFVEQAEPPVYEPPVYEPPVYEPPAPEPPAPAVSAPEATVIGADVAAWAPASERERPTLGNLASERERPALGEPAVTDADWPPLRQEAEEPAPAPEPPSPVPVPSFGLTPEPEPPRGIGAGMVILVALGVAALGAIAFVAVRYAETMAGRPAVEVPVFQPPPVRAIAPIQAPTRPPGPAGRKATLRATPTAPAGQGSGPPRFASWSPKADRGYGVSVPVGSPLEFRVTPEGGGAAQPRWLLNDALVTTGDTYVYRPSAAGRRDLVTVTYGEPPAKAAVLIWYVNVTP